MLSVEQLMRPRWKVVADYPNSPYPLGYLIECRHYDLEAIEHNTKYPAIFQPLQWWEERAESDLPEYVRVMPHSDLCPTCEGVWLRAQYWGDVSNLQVEIDNPDDESDFTDIELRYCLPATREEYEAYLKTK